MRINALRLTVLLTLSLCGHAAIAYYDDVHYALTYYIARQSGWTPEQAYRIASACSAVDWDARTEPVQLSQQLMAGFTPLGGHIHAPRNKFHAFRNESDPARRVIGNEPDAAAAQQEVYDRLAELKKFCTETTKNLGVYLHGFEDVYPHFGWGTYWGHNPADYLTFERAVKQGMHPGGSTDWVDYRQQHVLALCGWVNAELTPFMNAISPHQQARSYNQLEFYNVITALAEANKFPPPLDTDLDRMTFLHVGLSDKGAPAQTVLGLFNNDEYVNRITEYLKDPAIQSKMQKHLKGPDLEAGYEVINKALKDAGMTDTLPPHHIPYKLDIHGGPSDPAQLDEWVLVGDVLLQNVGKQAATVTVLMDVRDAAGQARRAPLIGRDPVTIEPNDTHTMTNLPIGDLVLNAVLDDGTTVDFRLSLRKRKSELTFDPGGTPPPSPAQPPAPTKPPEEERKPVPAGIGDFNGTWFSSVGRFGYPHDPFVMSQSGNAVTGNFKHRTGSGTISGTVKDRTLTFTYTYTSGDYSETGTGSFVINKENKSFSGTYSSDKENGVKNNGWRGHKVSDFLSPLALLGERGFRGAGPRGWSVLVLAL